MGGTPFHHWPCNEPSSLPDGRASTHDPSAPNHKSQITSHWNRGAQIARISPASLWDEVQITYSFWTSVQATVRVATPILPVQKVSALSLSGMVQIASDFPILEHLAHDSLLCKHSSPRPSVKFVWKIKCRFGTCISLWSISAGLGSWVRFIGA